MNELEIVFDRIERDAGSHRTSGPADPADIDRVETELGGPLPASVRAFWERFGGGLFYGRHEIFGPRTVFVHDIELVAGAIETRRALLPNTTAAKRLLPIHQAEGVVHFVELTGQANSPGRVVLMNLEQTHADFRSFLESLMLAAHR